MEFEKSINRSPSTGQIDDQINVRRLIEYYGKYWKIFLISLIFSLLIAFTFLRYIQFQYDVYATIFINDEESGGISSELTALEDLGILAGGAKTSIINEKGVLKSRTLIEKVIKDLRLNESYFLEGSIIDHEIYGDQVPFKIMFLEKDSRIHRLDTLFMITILSKSKYVLKNGKGEMVAKYDFGESVKTNFGEMNLTPEKLVNRHFNQTIKVKLSPVKIVAKNYRNRIEVNPESYQSSLLVLTLRDRIRQKAMDILNNLIEQYNSDAINYKLLVTKNTDLFINNRIKDISLDLTDVDKGVEEFKERYKLTDLEFEASLDLTSNSEIQKVIVDLNGQIKVVDYVKDFIIENEDALIPENIGIKDQAAIANTSNYNKLLLERNRILKGSSELNPTVINLDSQISKLRESIIQSLTNLRSSLEFSLSEARAQENLINRKRGLAPQQEREFQDIKRKQIIIESLYLYLLQKERKMQFHLGYRYQMQKL